MLSGSVNGHGRKRRMVKVRIIDGSNPRRFILLVDNGGVNLTEMGTLRVMRSAGIECAFGEVMPLVRGVFTPEASIEALSV
jgi:hypothetical protein